MVDKFWHVCFMVDRICYQNFIGDKKNHGCSETGLANDSEGWAYHFFCCFGNFSMNSGSCRRKGGYGGAIVALPGHPFSEVMRWLKRREVP